MKNKNHNLNFIVMCECDYIRSIRCGNEIKYYSGGSIFAKLNRHRYEYTKVVEVYDRSGVKHDCEQFRKIKELEQRIKCC